MNILVTGAAGYIGSVLTVELMEHGHTITALDRFFFGRDTLPEEGPQLRKIQGDTRSIDLDKFQNIDAVVDLAALSNDPAGELNPEVTWQINHRARVEMARMARQCGVGRYILPSSCSVYGFQEGVLDESSAVNPLTTYAKANFQAEEDILPLRSENFCVTVLRQATVYGLSPRMRFDLAVNGMTKGIYENGIIPIQRDGNQWRPFVHVRDAALAIRTILAAPFRSVNGERFNVGSDDQNVQILPLARTISEAMGLPFEHEWYGMPDERSYRVNFAKIKEVLDYQPEYGLADGAREVLKALETGAVQAKDLKTNTVQWYTHLLDMQRFIKDIEIDGKLL